MRELIRLIVFSQTDTCNRHCCPLPSICSLLLCPNEAQIFPGIHPRFGEKLTPPQLWGGPDCSKCNPTLCHWLAQEWAGNSVLVETLRKETSLGIFLEKLSLFLRKPQERAVSFLLWVFIMSRHCTWSRHRAWGTILLSAWNGVLIGWQNKGTGRIWILGDSPELLNQWPCGCPYTLHSCYIKLGSSFSWFKPVYIRVSIHVAKITLLTQCLHFSSFYLLFHAYYSLFLFVFWFSVIHI